MPPKALTLTLSLGERGPEWVYAQVSSGRGDEKVHRATGSEQQPTQTLAVLDDDRLIFSEHAEDTEQGLARGFVSG